MDGNGCQNPRQQKYGSPFCLAQSLAQGFFIMMRERGDYQMPGVVQPHSWHMNYGMPQSMNWLSPKPQAEFSTEL
jgi:hypothetical protein